MNKVITINLGGTAYQLEEGGYDALRAYLETATARLQGNPDRDEILSDIERAIAEKFRALLGSHKTVVVTKEVAAVLAEMGPIEADAGEAAAPGAGGAGAPSSASGHGTAGEERAAGRGGTPQAALSDPRGRDDRRRLQRDRRLCERRSDLRAAWLRSVDDVLGHRVARLSGDGDRRARGAFAGRKGGGVRRPIDGAGIHPARERRVLRGDEGLPRPQGAPRMEAAVQAGDARWRVLPGNARERGPVAA